MIELSEKLVPLKRSPRLFPLPQPPHIATVIRWALRGVGPSRIRLETVKVGGRRFVTEAAIRRFLIRVNEVKVMASPQPNERLEQIRHAAAENDEANI